MTRVCKEVENIAPEVTASILAVDTNGRVHPLAAPVLPDHICAALDGVQISPTLAPAARQPIWANLWSPPHRHRPALG